MSGGLQPLCRPCTAAPLKNIMRAICASFHDWYNGQIPRIHNSPPILNNEMKSTPAIPNIKTFFDQRLEL